MHFCIFILRRAAGPCVEVSVLGGWSGVKSQPPAKNVPHSPPSHRFKSSIQFHYEGRTDMQIIWGMMIENIFLRPVSSANQLLRKGLGHKNWRLSCIALVSQMSAHSFTCMAHFACLTEFSETAKQDPENFKACVMSCPIRWLRVIWALPDVGLAGDEAESAIVCTMVEEPGCYCTIVKEPGCYRTKHPNSNVMTLFPPSSSIPAAPCCFGFALTLLAGFPLDLPSRSPLDLLSPGSLDFLQLACWISSGFAIKVSLDLLTWLPVPLLWGPASLILRLCCELWQRNIARIANAVQCHN